MESEIEVVKISCAKTEKSKLVWLVDFSVKRCEYYQVSIIEIFNDNNKLAHGELNTPVVMLATVFYDGVSETKNRASDVGAF